MTLEIPDWCVIGKTIMWSAENITGCKWVTETITAYGVDGFFHQANGCPEYFTPFSEYGKTVKEGNA